MSIKCVTLVLEAGGLPRIQIESLNFRQETDMLSRSCLSVVSPPGPHDEFKPMLQMLQD